MGRGQRLAEDAQRGVDLVVAHEERRGDADGVGPDRVDQQPVVERPGCCLLGHRRLELRREKEAGAADRDDTGERRQPGGQARATLPGASADVLGLHDGERRLDGGQGERLAAEGRPVIAWPEGGRHLGPGPAGADGHAVAERLGHRHDIWLQPLGLEGEPVPRAAEAGLHLVEHEQRVALAARARTAPR